MKWTPDQRALLLRLAESGELCRDQLAHASGQGALQPTAAEWRALLDRILAFGGALLLTAAAVFFLAYNWDAMHRFARLGVVTGVLAACCAGALFARPPGVGWRAALFGACVATGAVLALVGQTYQTGADVWQLFAAWAALMLPFAWLSRSSASWVLWLGVANLALMRALSQSVWWGFFDALSNAHALLAIAAFNLIVLLVFEGLARRLIVRPTRWMHRLAALGVLAPLCAGAVLGWWESEFRVVAATFSIVAGLAAAIYHRVRRDLPILALAVYGGIAVLAAGLVKLLRVESFLSMNLVGLFIIGASAAAGMWLAGLHRAVSSRRRGEMSGSVIAAPVQPADALRAHGVVDDTQYDRLVAVAQVPWWLMLLQTLAAWVASVLILSSFMLPLSLLGDHALVRAIAGVVLCAVAVALFGRDRLFTGQMALAFSLAGQALVVSATGSGWGAVFDGGRLWAATGLVVAAAMMWPRSTSLHRSLCALLMAFHAGALIGEGTGLAVYGAGLAAAVATLWLSRPQWAGARNGGQLAALTRGGTVAALALPAVVGIVGEDAWRFALAGGSPFAPQADVLSIGAGLVFVAVAGWLTTTADVRTRRAALAAALVLAMLSQPAPGLLVAASLALACFHGAHRGFAALALAAAVAYVGEYYYRLDTSLLVKSALMTISGGVLLALRHALRAAARPMGAAGDGARYQTPHSRGEGGAMKAGAELRLAVVAAFALLVGATVHSVIRLERVLDEGRVVLLELAPVDPRSLMQGDYMGLRFAIDDALPSRNGAPIGPPPRFAHLDVDAEGRARLAGVGEELPVSSASVALRIRVRDRALSVGPNAFFFQEGQAAVFEGARWGEFRVGADGTALLTHLRDEKLLRLGAPRP